jgi:SAM-dependent methyltransferase
MTREEQIAYLAPLAQKISLKDHGIPTGRIQVCRWEIALIERIWPHLLKGASVLDVGAASGYFTFALTQAGSRATGLEPIPALVEYGRQFGLDLHCGRFEWEELPDVVREQRFDLICLRECISCFPDLKGTFKLIQTLLVPGGRLYIKMHQARSYYYLTCSDYTSRYGSYSGSMPTRDSLIHILKNEGFVLPFVSYYPFSDLISDMGWPRFGRSLPGRVMNKLAQPLLNVLGRNDRLVVLAAKE